MTNITKENITKENIMHALAVLKDMCSLYTTCSNCPVFVGDCCRIKYSDPANYNLKLNEGIWRAFDD